MPDFSNGVNPPGGASYTAPLLSFDAFGDWGNSFQQGTLNRQQVDQNKQQQQLNQQRIDIGTTFKNGLPIDPATGQIDYKRAVAMLAQKGDINALWNGADAMLSQSATNLSPMLSGGAQPAAGPGGGGAAPASVPARPLPPPNPNSPQGDSGSGTIAALVTDKLPNQDATTGQTIAKIAQTMGVDPNATLTPGQLRRAQGLLQRYASAAPADTPADSGSSGGQDGSTSFKERFSAAGGGASGSLPPSANAVSPAPRVNAAPATAGGQGQPQPGQPGQAQGAPQGGPALPQGAPVPAQPQPPQGGPIVPQVPLPKGFTDPQQAILALRAEAARLSANPRAAGQVAELNNYAQRIEQSIQPVKVGQYDTYLDPRDSHQIYQGPGAAALAAGGSPTLDADAARYRQTGTLPPNMGRGVQGEAQAKAIRARAVEQEVAAGGDPADWPDKWQDFKARGVGKSASERVKANREENLNLILKAADAAIPAALEASKALPRGQYVPLNKLIQKGEIMSSDPRLVEFGMANLQLAEHWARAMNPTGVMRESDRDKALSFLDTAYGNNTYERAVMQLQKQITRERDAVRGGGTILKDNKAPDPSAEVKSTDWVRGPDGKLGPAK